MSQALLLRDAQYRWLAELATLPFELPEADERVLAARACLIPRGVAWDCLKQRPRPPVEVVALVHADGCAAALCCW